MKKKAIEKIPFLTLPGVRRGKTVEYVAVTDIREIAAEPHLFIEVYRNRKGSKDIPVVRIALTGKDFGTFFPGTGAWSGSRITSNTWDSHGLIWREDDGHVLRSREDMEKENVLYSQKDLERIRAFTNETVWREKSWWDFIDQRQEDITSEKYRKKGMRKYERRQAALEERIENTGILPEGKILQYADQAVFGSRHTIFYRKHGPRVTVACTECGGVTVARWKQGQSYESRFERTVAGPVENHYGICPECGKTGVYVPQGRAGRMRAQKGYLFLGQQYQKTGLVLRYVEVEKEWVLKETWENGLEMVSAHEKLSGTEVARIYFEPGKKVQKDYHKHSPYSGKDFWDDCNLSGLANITIKPGKIMPETFGAVKGSFLRYSALEEYCAAEKTDTSPVDYLERYLHTPQIEMLVKMGLTGVVRELMACHYGIVQDADAERPELFLGIRKERVKQLVREKGDTDILTVMQMERRMHRCWTDSQIKCLAEAGIGDRVSEVLTYMGVQKFLNRVAKYAGCGYGTGCSTAVSRLQGTASRYTDYLNMRHALGYDMTNTVYLFPRNLDAAHARMVEESNRKEADIRIASVCARYPLIKKHYRRYRKQFYFADGEFLIRPARDAGEIVMEGRILHHCVGRDGYLKKHNDGKGIILFLRAADAPDTPYITVEIDPEKKKIRQWYGAHDKKPDKERMQEWLDAYVARLKGGQGAAGQDAAQETGQGLPAAM